MKDQLNSIGLNSDNSIVIGSGILQALGIRPSNDIDLITTASEYERLQTTGQFSPKIVKNGKQILANDLFEIGTYWEVLDKKYEFADFVPNSTVIDGVRYLTLDFLYQIKSSWLKNNTARPKDIADIKLMEDYFAKQK